MNLGVDDGGVPTHNLTPRNAISERIAVNKKFISNISTLIYRKVVEGPLSRDLVFDSHHNGPQSRLHRSDDTRNDS